MSNVPGIHGEARAQFNLGSMYQYGYGVPVDYVRAYMWFNLAAASGYQNAAKSIKIIKKRMTPSQIEKAQHLAREWKPKKSR